MNHWKDYHEANDTAARSGQRIDRVLLGFAVVVVIAMVLIAPRIAAKAHVEFEQLNSPQR